MEAPLPHPPPHPSGNSNQPSYINFFNIFGLQEPSTLQEIPIPSVGEYGYFLELHIIIL